VINTSMTFRRLAFRLNMVLIENIKSEFRNPKFKTISNDQKNGKLLNKPFRIFSWVLNFKFVSDFDIRISDLFSARDFLPDKKTYPCPVARRRQPCRNLKREG